MTAADVTFQDYRLVNPDSVTPHPDNPRRGHLAAITESIRANGFYGAIVVQASTQRVIAGNHRLLAARELGLAQIPATFVDVDDQTALRILAVDNRANDLAGYDNDALLELLTTLDATEMRLEGTGYTDADLDQLLNPQPPPNGADAASLIDEWQGMPEYTSEDKAAWQTVHVHLRNEADRAAFAAAVGQPVGDGTRYLWYPPEPWDRTADLAYVAEETP